AHREAPLTGGEPAWLRGFPPSPSHLIMSPADRTGPGTEETGDITALFSVLGAGSDMDEPVADDPRRVRDGPHGIAAGVPARRRREEPGDMTAIFSVLVAGSDMDEPVADILRGVLDGHVVMERESADRGRYPAINLLRSVSRSLPRAATDAENALISRARRLLGAYDRAEMMIQAGLYAAGSDPLVDSAIRVWPALDAFLSDDAPDGTADSFARLRAILDRAEPERSG